MDEHVRADLPEWTRSLGVFDLETTGVDVAHDRIVTAHVGLLDADGTLIRSEGWLVDPGIEIPEAATRVHGVTTAHARAHGRPAGEAVAEIVAAVNALLRAGVPVVAFNAAYDLSLLAHEAGRHGVAPIAQPFPVIDPLILDKACDRFRRGKRTLAAVAEHYAVPLDDAHEASADAIAAGRVARALAGRFGDELALSAADLHTRQVGWAREQAESLSAYFVKIGRLSPGDSLDGAWPVR